LHARLAKIFAMLTDQLATEVALEELKSRLDGVAIVVRI
jgi:hypothetical protein